MASVQILFHRSHLNPRMELFAETLVEEGHEVSALCWDRGGSSNADSGSIPSTRISGPSIDVSMLNIVILPIVYLQFLRALQHKQTDIIFCAHVSLLPLAVSVGKLTQTSIVYDVVDPRIEEYSERDSLFAPLISFGIKSIEEFCLYGVDGITVIDTANDIIKKRYEGFTENIEVVYNLPKLKPRPNRNNSNSVIVYVGVLDERKGVTALLDGFAIAHKEHPEAELLYIGDSVSDTADRLQRRAEELGIDEAVEFAGRVDYPKVHELLSRGDIAAAPYQPVPMNRIVRWNARKLSDYMNSELPVVLPDFGGFPEIVSATNCGVTVDTTDKEAIGDALGTLIDNPEQAKQMGANGRRAVENQYNWEAESSKVIKVIQTAQNR